MKCRLKCFLPNNTQLLLNSLSISPAPCLQSLAVRWRPFQYHSDHATSLLKHLLWWDEGGATQNLSPSWVSLAPETWVQPAPGRLISSVLRSSLCFTLGSWNKSSLSGPGNLSWSSPFPEHSLFKHLMKQLLCSFCYLISATETSLNVSSPWRGLISSLSSPFSVLQGCLAM